jgi:hypothetical protein
MEPNGGRLTCDHNNETERLQDKCDVCQVAAPILCHASASALPQSGQLVPPHHGKEDKRSLKMGAKGRVIP